MMMMLIFSAGDPHHDCFHNPSNILPTSWCADDGHDDHLGGDLCPLYHHHNHNHQYYVGSVLTAIIFTFPSLGIVSGMSQHHYLHHHHHI